MSRLLALVTLLFASAAAQAQAGSPPPRPADVVSWRVMSHGGARGSEAHVMFEATIAPGWKMYALDSPVGLPLQVGLSPLPAGFTAAAPTQTEATRAFDEAFGAEASTFSRTALITQPLRVSRSAARGQQIVSGQVRYAVCDAEICLPPATAPFRVAVTVR